MPKGRRLPKVVRITAALDPAVAKVFQKMASISGSSLSRTIGDWCAQTVDGAEVAVKLMAQAKDAPRFVMAEMHARASSIQGFIDSEAPAAHGAGAKHEPARRSAVSPIRAGTPRPVIRGESPPTEKGTT